MPRVLCGEAMKARRQKITRLTFRVLDPRACAALEGMLAMLPAASRPEAAAGSALQRATPAPVGAETGMPRAEGRVGGEAGDNAAAVVEEIRRRLAAQAPLTSQLSRYVAEVADGRLLLLRSEAVEERQEPHARSEPDTPEEPMRPAWRDSTVLVVRRVSSGGFAVHGTAGGE